MTYQSFKKIFWWTVIISFLFLSFIISQKILRFSPITLNNNDEFSLSPPPNNCFLSFASDNKVFLHAAYIPPANSLISKYKGLECDLVFHDNKLYCNHDSPSGQQLHEWVKQLNAPESHYYWLDIKNLNGINKFMILKIINIALAQNHISHEQVIIESTSCQNLDVFTDASYFTSFYLNIPFNNPKLCQKSMQDAVSKAKKGKFHAVSCDIYGHELCKKYFPNMLYLHWGIPTSNNILPVSEFFRKLFYTTTYQNISKDPRVRVMLVDPV